MYDEVAVEEPASRRVAAAFDELALANRSGKGGASACRELAERNSASVTTMTRTLFGATGGTGTRLVERAPAAGREITAVVRDPARLAVPAHQRL